MIFEIILVLFVPAIIFLILGLTTNRPILSIYSGLLLIVLSVLIMISGISIPIGWSVV